MSNWFLLVTRCGCVDMRPFPGQGIMTAPSCIRVPLSGGTGGGMVVPHKSHPATDEGQEYRVFHYHGHTRMPHPTVPKGRMNVAEYHEGQGPAPTATWPL